MARLFPRKTRAKTSAVDLSSEEETLVVKTNGKSGKKAAAVKVEVEVEKKSISKRKSVADFEVELDGTTEEAKKPAAKKRKTKAEKEDENMPLAARTVIASMKRAMYIGAHVSGAGGVHNSVQNATNIGANSFALFLKSQRKWESPPLADEHRDQFRSSLKRLDFDAKHILPHGSYLVNLAQAEPEKADKAFGNFLDDLQRCEALGIKLYNFHPGSSGGDTKEAAVARIAAQLNKSHKATETVVTVIENMCGSGNIVGSKFEELRDIISQIKDKSRVGVCIDTCHAFAAGYDMCTPKAFAETMRTFDEIVGLKYLKALHINDSKAPLGSHRDLHANIGTGFLGLGAFHSIMNYAPFQDLPMVLETPIDRKGPDGKSFENKQVWADEIKLLESLIGMDADTDEFRAKARDFQSKGAAERERVQDQVDKKAEKDAKKGAAKGKRKGAKKSKASDLDSDSD